MDCSSFSITTLMILLVPVLIFLLINKPKKSKSIYNSINIIPGPKQVPIIGHLHLMMTSSLPFRLFRELSQKYGPIMQLRLGEVPTIIVSSPEIAREVLKERDPSFADRPGSIGMKIMWYNYVNLSFSPYGDYWKQMRKICIMELLNAKNVRSFGSIRNDEISRLVGRIHLSSGKPINLSKEIFSMVSSVTSRAAFGKVCKDGDTLVKLLNEGTKFAGGFELGDLFPSSKIINRLSWSKMRMVMMRRKIDVILDGVINEHRENLEKMRRENNEKEMLEEENESGRKGNGEFGNEDLVDVLIRIQESGELQFPIGNDNIKGVLYDMFGAGSETSSTTIDWTMTELLRNPGVMAKAQAEVRQLLFKEPNKKTIHENDLHNLKYLKLVIKESLRLHPPVPLIPRASRQESQVNGFKIPPKVKTIINTWSIHRDPKYWADPQNFEPERFENQPGMDFAASDFRYIPFGAGRRICPGIAFGLAGVELPLAHFLYSFNWSLPHGIKPQDLDMTENPGIAAPRRDHLYVVASPYQPMA